MDSATNRAYKRGQSLFVVWAAQHDISLMEFTSQDLINFLTSAAVSHYSVNMLQLFRSAILRLHIDPSSVHTGDLAHLFSSLRRYTPLISLSQTFATLPHLSENFLLALTAFLRPSDLARIDLSQSYTYDQILCLVIPIPKETRGGRRIVKSLAIHAHPSFPSLRPVLAFCALRDYPLSVPRPPSTLFVNSKHPDRPIQTSTTSSWLSHLVRLSTSVRPTPLLRSIALDLALGRGMPIEGVVTVGNWSFSAVFEQHYRRQRAPQTNIS
ncbi:hypothetical protein CLU79DRAFT_880701 [Phycomyces nitens]|nr:hypothetical protein CLU79DRAFT_880701 [Phycomyces nitens]